MKETTKAVFIASVRIALQIIHQSVALAGQKSDGPNLPPVVNEHIHKAIEHIEQALRKSNWDSTGTSDG